MHFYRRPGPYGQAPSALRAGCRPPEAHWPSPVAGPSQLVSQSVHTYYILGLLILPPRG